MKPPNAKRVTMQKQLRSKGFEPRLSGLVRRLGREQQPMYKIGTGKKSNPCKR
jgi:hypothetical protein